MPSVTIDTCVLAAPPMTATRDDIQEFVETLLDWQVLLHEPWVAIYMSEHAAEVMLNEGVYPLRDCLRQLFKTKGVIEFDPNTIARVVDDLLQKTPSFETYFCINDVLVDDVSTIPDLLSLHTDNALSSELARCVVMIALLRSCCHQPVSDHNLIVKPWQGTQIVRVSALVHDIETIRDDLDVIPEPPEYFQGDVLTCQNFRELVMNLNETAIWQAADCETGLALATKIAVYKSRIARGVEPEWDSIQGFSFGHEFYRLTRACEHAGSPGFVERTIRSIVETIDEIDLPAVHELRGNQGGNSEQRMRGQDLAWRRDIDREYHLHYWSCANGTLEFASVNTHNFFDIPE